MLCVCVYVYLDVNQGGTSCNCRNTETCNLACTDLLMNRDRTPKLDRSDYFAGQNSLPKSVQVFLLCMLGAGIVLVWLYV